MTDEQKEAHRQRNRVLMAKRRDEMRRVIREAKDVPCADCDGRWPHFVMHFHHPNGDKAETISHMIRNPLLKGAIERLKEEIAKCVVLCANCHALRHGGVFDG